MKRFIRSVVLLAAGAAAALAWMAIVPGSRPASDAPDSGASAKTEAAAQVWTCSMHPQIRMDHKDICPLCGMDLTPVDARQDPWEADDPGARLVLNEQARRMASVETMEVLPRELFKDLRTVGRLEFDETRVAHIAARINGRVDQVYADFPGTPVRRGEHLVKIYSPDLLSTQQEFLTALRGERSRESRVESREPKPSQISTPSSQLPAPSSQLSTLDSRPSTLSAASRRRLLLWGITEQQIDELAKSGQAQDHLTVYAPMGGTVIEKNIRPGQYVKEGDSLYTIADLGRLWLVLEVYESELSWVRVGQAVQVTLESDPHRLMTGSVTFIEPVLTNTSRTIRVRVIVENQESRLKPGMYAQALIRVPILPGGKLAPTGLEGKYVCPMHPYEVSDRPGLCEQCKMPLELVPPLPGAPAAGKSKVTLASESRGAASESTKVLAVPADAVLTTGQRQLVYVEKEPGKYQLVEPKLGPRAGDYYPVWSGLNRGDRVVTRGNFLLDSQYQITGRVSLLYPEGSTGEYAGPDPATGFTPKEQANLDKLPAEERSSAAKQKICPITGARLGSMGVPVKIDLNGRPLWLCCKGCEAKAKADPAAAFKKLESPGGGSGSPPEKQPPQAAAPLPSASSPFTADELEGLNELPPQDRELAKRQKVCPVTDMNLGSMGKPFKMTVQGRPIFLCCEGCEDTVKANPAAMLKKIEPKNTEPKQ